MRKAAMPMIVGVFLFVALTAAPLHAQVAGRTFSLVGIGFSPGLPIPLPVVFTVSFNTNGTYTVPGFGNEFYVESTELGVTTYEQVNSPPSGLASVNVSGVEVLGLTLGSGTMALDFFGIVFYYFGVEIAPPGVVASAQQDSPRCRRNTIHVMADSRITPTPLPQRQSDSSGTEAAQFVWPMDHDGDRELSTALHFTVFEVDPHYQGRQGTRAEPRELVLSDLTGDDKLDIALLVHDRVLPYPAR